MRSFALALVLLASCSTEEAKQRASKAVAAPRDKVESVASEASAKARDVAGQVAVGISETVVLGQRVKSELDKVYASTTDYDLAVEREPSPDLAKHAAALAAMPNVTVGDVTVGYEEDASLSLRGTTYAKHFRATWRRGDDVVRVHFYTHERLDAVAFAKLLERLVPIVQRVAL